jgi:hypothetical protein
LLFVSLFVLSRIYERIELAAGIQGLRVTADPPSVKSNLSKQAHKIAGLITGKFAECLEIIAVREGAIVFAYMQLR